MARSLSSIPTGEQRALQLAMQEVADWMALPGNEEEFVVLFFDDQMDINDWVRDILRAVVSQSRWSWLWHGIGCTPKHSCIIIMPVAPLWKVTKAWSTLTAVFATADLLSSLRNQFIH